MLTPVLVRDLEGATGTCTGPGARCTSNQRLAPALVRAPGGTVLQKCMRKHHEVSLHAISPKLSCFEVSL